MSEDYGGDLLTISDEDGNDYTLEHIDTIEVGDTFYMACLPVDMDEDDEDFGFVILEVVGDDELATVDDDVLLEELYNIFIERLFDDDDDDDETTDE